MSRIPPAVAVSYVESIFIQNCLNAATVAFLTYDYLLTLGSEVDIIWCRRGPVVSRLAFLFLRASVLGYIISTAFTTFRSQHDASIDNCTSLYNFSFAVWYLGYLTLSAVTNIRAYALTGGGYGRWIWTIFMSLLSLVNIGLNAYFDSRTSYRSIRVKSSWMCWGVMDISATRILKGKLAAMICDTIAAAVVVVATWARTVSIIRLRRPRSFWSHSNLSWLLFRDGTAYFLALCSLNVTLYVISLRFKILSSLVNLDIPLQLVLMSRLLINLREASEVDIYMDSNNTYSGNYGIKSSSIELSSLRFKPKDTLDTEEASGMEPTSIYGISTDYTGDHGAANIGR